MAKIRLPEIVEVTEKPVKPTGKNRPSHLRKKTNTVGKSRRGMSGTKQSKKYGGKTYLSDYLGRACDAAGMTGLGSYRVKPNHHLRYARLEDCYPLLRAGH